MIDLLTKTEVGRGTEIRNCNSAEPGPVRERELQERVAQGQRINEFFSETMLNLSGEAELPAVIESIIATFAKYLNAAHVFLFRYDPASETIRLDLSFLEGRIRRGMSGDEMALWAKPFPAAITPAWRIMCEQRGLFTPSMIPISAEKFGWPGALEYATRYSLSDMGHIVLFGGEKAVGSIGFGLRNGRYLQPADKTFIEAVAQQAAVAVRLVDLADEARLAAITVERQNALLERERIARKQAEEVAKANTVIAESLRQITKESDPSGVAGIVLLEIARQAGAQVCYWFHYDAAARTLCTSLRVNGGVLLEKPDSDEPELFLSPFPTQITGAFEALLGSDDLISMNTEADSPMLWPGTTDWHRRHGRTEAVAYLVRMGDQPFGVLGMGFADRATLTDSQKQLIRALANHLALATHLSRLSEEASRTATLNERNRIAREIHDSLAQCFTGILMQLQAARRLAQRSLNTSAACVGRAEGLARSGLMQARRSVMTLVQEDELYQDLGSALRSLIENATADTETAAKVEVTGLSRAIHPLIAVNILRICQEALGNAQRYARARQISVELTFEADAIQLCVQDDGVGFVLADVVNTGYGLQGMQERAERIGATLSLLTAPGAGTKVSLNVLCKDVAGGAL